MLIYGNYSNHPGVEFSAGSNGFQSGEDAFVVHAPRHESCSPKDILKKLIGANHNLVDYTTHPDTDKRNSCIKKSEIRGANPWSENPARMPDGYTPGASGSTEYWIEYWQHANALRWWAFWEQHGPKVLHRSYIQIMGATWRFRGFQETKIMFAVKSNTATRNNAPDRNEESYQANKGTAKALADRMKYELLKVSKS